MSQGAAGSGEAPSERRVASSIGKYRLIAELGTGGMANVYLAVMRGHSGFHKLVVLKVPKSEVTKDPNLLAMFIDEARIAARLSHPNVVQTFEVIREGSRDIIVMEYLDGYTLNELIVRAVKHGTRLPQALHLKIIAEALTGLHYAHEAKDFDGAPLNLVHRDMSPHNVFLTFDSQVKILDFGIAKAAMQSHQTEFGTFKGKVRYMPREQLAGSSMDRRTDIFAVGAMVWEAAVGERLWKKRSDVEVMSAIIAGDVPMPRDVKPDVPEKLDAICRKALAHDKTDRYASCLELQADLDAYLVSQSERPTMREVVSFLETVFAEQRAARRKIIDDQLKTVNLTDEPSALPSIPPPSTTISLSAAALPALNTTGSGSMSMTGTPITGTGAAGVAVPSQQRSKTPLVLVALVLLAVVLGAVAVLMRFGLKANQGPVVSEPAASSVSPANGALAPTTAPQPSAAIVEPIPTATPTPNEQPPAKASASPTPAAPATQRWSSVAPKPATPTPGLAPQPSVKPTAVDRAPSATAAVSDAPGFFSFTTYPWTKVSEGGRVLGTTPLYKIPLSPGTHVLTLENPDENIKSSFTVVIKSGESVNRSMALK